LRAKLELLLKPRVDRIVSASSLSAHLLQLLGAFTAPSGTRSGPAARAVASKHSIDLMHGLPIQSRDDCCRALGRSISIDAEHISAYGLIYETARRANSR